MKYILLIVLLISLPALSSTNIWAGYGQMSQSKEKYQREDIDTQKLVTWGIGYGFLAQNLIFFESGYGLPSTVNDYAKDRTSFLKVGFERYFSALGVFPYLGIGYGYVVRTVEAKKRSNNWQTGDQDYDITGTKKRSSLSYLVDGTFGIRFFRDLIPGVTFDLNAISLFYNKDKVRYLTSLNLVYVFGRQ